MTTTDQTYEQTYSPFITDGEFFGEASPPAQTVHRQTTPARCAERTTTPRPTSPTPPAPSTSSTPTPGPGMRQADVALPLLGQHMFLLHNDRGDYQQLREEADAYGNLKGPLRLILGVHHRRVRASPATTVPAASTPSAP